MDTEIEVLAETENFSVWRTDDPDDEVTYHLELGSATIHFFQEEWDELKHLLAQV